MAGEAFRMINTIIEKRSKGNSTIANTTRAKLIMKGINLDQYTLTSEDNPAMIQTIKKIAEEMGVTL